MQASMWIVIVLVTGVNLYAGESIPFMQYYAAHQLHTINNRVNILWSCSQLFNQAAEYYKKNNHDYAGGGKMFKEDTHKENAQR